MSATKEHRSVWVDVYNDQVVVFIAGHALVTEECTYEAAEELVALLGQPAYIVTDYRVSPPARMRVSVG